MCSVVNFFFLNTFYIQLDKSTNAEPVSTEAQLTQFSIQAKSGRLEL